MVDTSKITMENAAMGGNALPARQLYWEECQPGQQISRLREEVARLCRVVSWQAETIRQLSEHEHGQTGALLIPISGPGENMRSGLFAHDDGIPHQLRTERERR